MGVDDTFVLPDSYNNAYRAMGDAVAVPVVAWLSDNLLIPIAETHCPVISLRLDTVENRLSAELEHRANAMAKAWDLATF